MGIPRKSVLLIEGRFARVGRSVAKPMRLDPRLGANPSQPIGLIDA